MNIETASAHVRTIDEAVKYAAVPDKYTEEHAEAEVLPERASGAYDVNIGTIDEYVSSTVVPDKQNK